MSVTSSEVKLMNWCEFVQQVAPHADGTTHPILYQATLPGSNPRFEVLSPEQNVNSSTHRKCSLSEIISTTRQVATPFISFQDHDFIPSLQQWVHKGDSHPPRLADYFVKTFAKQLRVATALKGSIKSLEAMQQRAEAKQLNQKVSGIWGHIKWFVWSCFFNQESKIKELKRFIPELTMLNNTVFSELRECILNNMGDFIEQTESTKGLDFSNSEVRKQFATPSDIKEKWIVSYNADTYDLPRAIQKKWKESADWTAKRAGEMAKVRDRVIVLTKLWEDLLQIQESNGAQVNS